LPSFAICGSTIETVDRWFHVSHAFNAHLTNDDDVLARRNSFIGQANSFLCYFQMLDVGTKNSLVKVYTLAVITFPNCGTLQNNNLEDYFHCMHEVKAYKDYGCFHTIRANQVLP